MGVPELRLQQVNKMAANEIIITETIRKRHRPSLDELYDFIARFRGPGKIIVHIGMGGSIQQYDVVTSEKENSKGKPSHDT